MQGYRRDTAESKPTPLFELLAQARVTRKHLDVWVTRALAGIKPWVWELGPRLGITWSRNGNHDQGQHSKERGEREAQLARDVARLHRTRYFIACQAHKWRERASYLAVVGEAQRLLAAGNWWKPRRLVDRQTGEVRETVYLPEDTWSAQTALAWCVALLDRLLAALPRVTEKPTPRYRPGAPTTGFFRGRNGSEELKWLEEKRRRWVDPPGAQPELPARG